MKALLVSLVAFALAGCATGPQRPVSEACRMARADWQMCYGGCLSSTPGGILQAAGVCGNECRRESIALNRACN